MNYIILWNNITNDYYYRFLYAYPKYVTKKQNKTK